MGKQQAVAAMRRRAGYTLIFHLILSSSTVNTNDTCTIKTTGETCTCPKASTNTSQEKSAEKFTQGDNALIVAQGDVEIGCSFRKKDESGRICCYKRKGRENVKCHKTQPKACRNEDEYDVKEIPTKAGKPGECQLTLYNSQPSDSGLYTVFFAADINLKNEVNVIVMSVGFEGWKIALIVIAILMAGCPIFYCCVKPWLEDREKKLRTKDENMLKKLCSKCKCEDLRSHDKTCWRVFDIKNFNDKLGQRNILSLRDSRYNNIFHYASSATWAEDMTDAVLDLIPNDRYDPPATENNANDTEMHILPADNVNEDKRRIMFKKLIKCTWPNIVPKFISRKLLNCSNILCIRQYLMPEILLPFNININSQNLDRDTPLIIASNHGQVGVVEVLLEHKAELEVQNRKGYTALHKAVLKKNVDLVGTLLIKKASQNKSSENGQTPLHSAVQLNAIDIVKRLIPTKEGHEHLLKHQWYNNTLYMDETPVQVAVRKGLKEIVKYLINEKEDNSWKEDNRTNLTFYTAIAGGNQDIIKILMSKTPNYGAGEWKEIGQFCLIKAVEATNQTAVNNVYWHMMSLVRDTKDIEDALPKVKEMLKDQIRKEEEELDTNVGQTGADKQKPSDQMKSIIGKLEKKLETNNSQISAIPTNNTKATRDPDKKKYLDYIKKIKEKNNKKTIDDMKQDLEWLLDFQKNRRGTV